MEATIQNFTSENFIQAVSDPNILAVLAVIGFFGLIVGIVIAIVITIGIYIYFALALSTIAKKKGYSKPWLAWIPIANLFLFPILTERKWTWGLLFFIPVINVIFLVICLWKILEREGYDSKWSLILLGSLFTNPVYSFVVFVAFLIILGVLAWKKK
ncbi:DUF5684 domain-containing protein [Patescibacteria group bacterium]